MRQFDRQLGKVAAWIFVALSIGATSLHGQTLSLRFESTDGTASVSVAGLTKTAQENDVVLANRALSALQRLQANVITYRSMQDFESDGKLGRVPVDTFKANLYRIITEVEPMLDQLSDPKLRAHLRNALFSFRDGVFWWEKVTQSRVVTPQMIFLEPTSKTPSEIVFESNVPHTVAIYWRQAAKFLLRAQTLLSRKR